MWIYKRDGTRKSRWVIRGFEQVEGIDYQETFAPVAKQVTVRLLLSLAAYYDWDIDQLDVKTAFLNPKLHEEVYMQPPEGYTDPEEQGRVWRLLKALYGLKQAPREWYAEIDSFLTSDLDLAFTRSEFDHNLYIRDDCILLLYVDDMLIFTKSNAVKKAIKKKLMDKYRMTDLGEAKTFLGFQITRDRSKRTITIHQEKYVESVLGRFGMEKANGVFTPMIAGTILAMAANELAELDDIKAYQQINGSIMYAMTSTRPDLAFTISRLSKFNANPTNEHQHAAKRVLRYLRQTTKVGITYGGLNEGVGSTGKDVELVGFSDSDFGADPDNRRSIAGYIFTVNGGAISWKSKQQLGPALSTMEAEYVGLSEAGREAIWISGLYNNVNQFIEGRMYPPQVDTWWHTEDPIEDETINELSLDRSPVMIYGDNLAANSLTEDPKHHDRSKSIDIKYHWIRDAIRRQQIQIKHLPTTEMTADILTKALVRAKHEKFMRYMGMNV